MKKVPKYPNNNVEHATIALTPTHSVDVNYDLDDESPVRTAELRPSAGKLKLRNCACGHYNYKLNYCA